MLLINANLLILNDFMKAVSSILYAEGNYNEQVYWDFTIAFDQSDSRTHPCHVRMNCKVKTSVYILAGSF